MPNVMQIDSLPGWSFVQKYDLFKTIVVTAPNGYNASLSMVERNPGNVFYMLVKDLIDETERQGKQTSKTPDAS